MKGQGSDLTFKSFILRLLVARNRHPTETRISTKGNLLAYSVQKDAKVSHRKEEKTAEIREKKGSLIPGFSLSYFFMLQERWPPTDTCVIFPA